LWEMGQLVEVQQLLDNGVREGGRQASTGQRSVSDVQQAVVDHLARNGVTIPASAVAITNLTDSSRSDPQAGTPAPPPALRLDHFQVTVQVPVDSVRWVLLSPITGARTLNASADWFSMNNVP